MESELQALLDRMNDGPVLSREQARGLYRAHTDQILDKISAQTDAGLNVDVNDALLSAQRNLSILNQSEDAFRAELRSIDNDLLRQVAILNEGLDHWFEIGSVPPPYYAWRIAIILAKEKRPDDEKAFLTAWCRHFSRIVGGRYTALTDRARKRGLEF